MKKLLEKLETMGVNYEIQKYGESYFPNAPEIHYEAVHVRFDWKDVNRMKAEKEIEKYVNRSKKYVIFRDWYNLMGTGFCIAKIDDRKAHEEYRVFMDGSIHEWEIVAHELYQAGRDNEVNGKAREIMLKWQREYLKSKFHVVEIGA